MAEHVTPDAEKIAPHRVLLLVVLPLLGLFALGDYWFSFAMRDSIGWPEYRAFLVRLAIAALVLAVAFGITFLPELRTLYRRLRA